MGRNGIKNFDNLMACTPVSHTGTTAHRLKILCSGQQKEFCNEQSVRFP